MGGRVAVIVGVGLRAHLVDRAWVHTRNLGAKECGDSPRPLVRLLTEKPPDPWGRQREGGGGKRETAGESRETARESEREDRERGREREKRGRERERNREGLLFAYTTQAGKTRRGRERGPGRGRCDTFLHFVSHGALQ
jgi:hypothetical protein